MKMKLGLEEDTNLEGTESVDPIEEASADQEANEAVEEATEEVEEVVDMGMNICEVIDNLTSLRAHVKKFGVTKQMLHLVNANNQLGDAIGITLPYYESDDEADDINEDEIPSEEVVMEGFGEGLKKAKDAVVKFFKMIWEKLKSFGSAIAGFFTNYKKKFKSAEDKFKSPLDVEKMKDKKAKIISHKEMTEKIKALNSAVNAVKMWQAGDTMDADVFNTALKYAGKKIEGSEGSFKLGTVEKPAVEEATLVAHGWDKAKDILPQIKTLFSHADEIKKFESSIKKDEAAALKKADNAEEKKGITNGVSVKLGIFLSVTNEIINTTRMFFSIVDRLPVKSK